MMPARRDSPPTGEVVIKLPVPHPGQIEIDRCPARFIVGNCGRRWGKSMYLRRRLARGAIAGQPVAYFIPSYKLASEFWRAMVHTLRPITRYKNESEKHLELWTGGSLDVWSMDNEDAGLGRRYADVAVDEAAAFRKLQEMWQRNIRPTLTDLRGRAVFTSTPRGLTFFHELYGYGLDPTRPDWASFHYPSIANPHIQPEEIEAARRDLPERMFRQEYLAEFVDDAGSVFRGVGAVSILEPDLRGFVPGSGQRYVMGVDWGRDIDFTAICVLNATTMEQVYLSRFNEIGWALQRGRLRALFERYQPEAIWAEANSIGSVNIEELQADGLPVRPFMTTAASKGPLIDGLSLAIEQQQVKLLNDPVQRHELAAYSMDRSPNGTYRYSAPPGGHDDTVIALALAVMGARMGSSISMRQATVRW